MSILVTGGRGQLGRALQEAGRARGIEIIALGREELDVTDGEQLRQVLEHYRPVAVVHAAAYTQVDGCETDPDKAFAVNALGTRNVAVATGARGIPVLYISTDFVFDGRRSPAQGPYTEFDPPNPLSVYGRSKWAGEEFVRTMNPRHFIVRTAWLFGHEGKNFVRTILDLAHRQAELKIVHDQVGSPTYVLDLARQLLLLLETDYYGLYHVVNEGECSWFTLAQEVLRIAARYEPELAEVKVVPITTAELGRPAPRPSYSALRNYCLALTFHSRMRPWSEALEDYLQKFYQKEGESACPSKGKS